MNDPSTAGIEARPSASDATRGPVVHIHLKVVPGASRSTVVGPLGDRLKVRTAAAPEGGKANRAVLELLATHLGVPLASLRLVRGKSQPQKTVEVVGIDATTVAARLYS